MATIESEQKRDCTPSTNQAGASGAYDNSAITMIPPPDLDDAIRQATRRLTADARH